MLTRLFLLAAVMGPMVPGQGIACTCATPETVAAALDRADAVFTGRIVQKTPFYPTEGATLPWYLATVELHALWKGDPQAQVILMTQDTGIGCGMNLAEGSEYLFFAEASMLLESLQANGMATEAHFEVTGCSRSTHLSLAQATGALEELGDPLIVPNASNSISWLKALRARF